MVALDIFFSCPFPTLVLGGGPRLTLLLPHADCGMNVHHKCREKVANLCGINQKLLAEALNQVAQVGRRCGTWDMGQ